MKHIVIGTAGHIDHGKTEMIRALTGTDTDRLKEEKQRGISIELGFAHFTLPSGIDAGIVDVPGHEKFIRQMLAGASGIDMVILVVAADEGVMPQTKEHVDILRLLGIKKGLTVISKMDIVENEWLELVKEDVANYLQGTFLEDAPIIPISSTKREGFEKLVTEIDNIASTVTARSDNGIFRLPVDRVFTIKGFGTVVTGTAWNGRVSVGDTVEILPGGTKCRIRNLQNHNHDVEFILAGQRSAVALQGIAKDSITRGAILAEPGRFKSSYMVSCRLNVLESSPFTIKQRMRLRFYHGTNEVMGRVVILDGDAIEPGGSAFVQFRLEEPVACDRMDRFVVRLYSPLVTLGGGRIIEPVSPKYKSHKTEVISKLRLEEEGSPAEIFVHRVTESAGEGYPITELLDNPLFHSLNASEIGELGLFKYGENIYSVDVTSKMKKNTLERVAEYHKENRLSYGISREELRRKITAETPGPLVEFVLDELVKNEELTIYGDRVALPEFEIVFNSQEKDIMERLMKIFLEGKFAPQRVDAVLDEFPDRKKTLQVFNALKEKGMLVRVTETLVFHVSVMEEIIEKTTSHIKENGSINVTDFKGIFGVSRKFAVPVLEYLDRIHVTRRSGDTRILF